MTNIIIFILIGIIGGILSGMFGIGGGIIIVPALVYICGFSQLKAQGTSLGILLLPVTIIAFLDYYKKGYVDIKACIIIALFLMVGSIFGTKLAHAIPMAVLKKSFAVLMMVMAIKMFFSK